MKTIKNFGYSMLLILCAVTLFSSCGAGAPKKSKDLVLAEGDNAILTNDGDYTTIVFPEKLTDADRAIYDTDLMGYLEMINAPISTDGQSWDGFSIYYYMHNSTQWLHKGIYSDPAIIKVADIAKLVIANDYTYLRNFNTKMTLKNNDKEAKNDSGYQQEIQFGHNYYYYIEVVLRD
ncbi:MAG: hypothetical protein MJY75_03210 [Bacteroidaceae bacterium]|nr:hypothetical protein [Bacteroidaceae bacterium]